MGMSWLRNQLKIYKICTNEQRLDKILHSFHILDTFITHGFCKGEGGLTPQDYWPASEFYYICLKTLCSGSMDPPGNGPNKNSLQWSYCLLILCIALIWIAPSIYVFAFSPTLGVAKVCRKRLRMSKKSFPSTLDQNLHFCSLTTFVIYIFPSVQ